MPFNLGCWGFTFPLGVYSLATLALAHATRLAFFSVLARIMHHASRFCAPAWRAQAIDPSVWIGVRQLAVQRVWD
jgi:tellurite resistance protein TehA-like permease